MPPVADAFFGAVHGVKSSATGTLNASASPSIATIVGFERRFSIRLTAFWSMPALAASASWLQPRSLRNLRRLAASVRKAADFRAGNRSLNGFCSGFFCCASVTRAVGRWSQPR